MTCRPRGPTGPYISLGLSLLLAGCGGGGGGGGGGIVNPPPADPPPVAENAFVATTDFVTGSYSTVNLVDTSVAADLPATPGIAESDNAAVYFNNRVYVLNRFGFDNVSVLETEDLSRAVRQFSTGNGSNPQDMAFVSDSRAYVSLYGSNELLRVNPTAPVGSEIVGRIDLSGYLDAGDADGLVEAGPMAKVGRYLFVALQRLSNFAAVTDGVLAVVDTVGDGLVDVDPATPGVQGIVLTGQNPVALEYAPDLGKLLVSAAGNFGVEDGGVEAVDPFTFASEGFLLDEAALGGDVGPLVSVRGRGVYVVAGGFDENRLLRFPLSLNPVAGTYRAGSPVDLGLALPFVPALAVDGADRLLVPDRSLQDPGLRLVDTFGDNVGAPIDVGLPPNAVVVTPPTPPTAFVATTDFVTGSYSTVNLVDASVTADLPATPGIAESDNAAVYFNNRVYVLNRFGFDNVSVLETEDLSQAVRQFSTGNGSNPQDMAFVSDSRAYVSLYGSNELLRVNPTAPVGSEIVGRIDLSGYLDAGDADGLVEAGPMAKVGRYLFVALQRLSNFAAVTDGVLAVVDTVSDGLVDVDPATPGVQGIVLTGQNPVALEYAPDLGKLLVSAAGNFGVEDGGVEAVDPFTFASEGFLLDEATLGGDVGPLVSVRGRRVYVVAGGFSENRLLRFPLSLDPGTGTYAAGSPRDLGLSLPFVPALAVDGADRLLVPDRSLQDPGLRLVDTFGDNVGAPIDVGLPPNAVIVLYP